MVRSTLQFYLLLSVSVLLGGSPVKRAPFFYNDHFGTAIMRSGKTCLMSHNSALTAQSRVVLVSLTAPQRTADARVIRKVSGGCASTDPSDSTQAGYELQVTNFTNRTESLLIAVFPPPRTSEQAAQTVAEINGKRLYFRACTSAEGAHLTVWQGKPLIGKLVWHQYWNLGYDTEPDCSRTETIAPKP